MIVAVTAEVCARETAATARIITVINIAFFMALLHQSAVAKTEIRSPLAHDVPETPALVKLPMVQLVVLNAELVCRVIKIVELIVVRSHALQCHP